MGTEGTDSKGKLWSIAAIVGVVAFVLLKTLVDYTFWPALLLAILIGVLVAILLWIGYFRDADEGAAALTGSVSTNTATPTAAAASTPDATVVSDAQASAAKKPVSKPKSGGKAKPESKTAAKPKASTKPAAGKKTAAAKKPATKAKSATKAVAKDGQPPLLKKARAGGADDLKVIKGVGPGLEKSLNELGFYHYDQISAWRKKEIEWVDERLKFKGRIVRDEWVKQCKSLAKG